MKYFLTLLLIFFYAPAWGATYTVSQSGAGADYSVAQFNALTGSKAGDTFNFSGTITTKVQPQIYGTSGNPVVLDGGTIGGTHCTINPSASTDAIWITNKDYITIQDFEITGYDGDAGIVIYGGCDHIIIKDCIIHDGTYRGIYLSYGTGGDPSYITIGGASGDGNHLYNIGEDHSACADIAMNHGNNIVISHNSLHGDATHGVDGITTEWADKILIEYNEIYSHNQIGQAENAIDLKSSTNEVIIRFNEIYDYTNLEEGTIHIQMDSDDVAIYGNRIYNGNCGILIFDGAVGWTSNGTHMNNIKIWSNLIYDHNQYGIYAYAGTPAGDSVNDLVIYNNVFAENGDDPSSSSNTGLRINTGSGHIVKNNIFYKNRPNESDYVQAYYNMAVTLDYNQYYWPGQTSKVYYSGGNRTIATLQGTYSKETNGADGDPGFTNADVNNYTLLGASNCKDDGKDLSGLAMSLTIHGTTYNMYYDDGLDDSYVDFSTTPPTVRTVKQDDYSSWEQGAYVYTSGADPTPLATLSGTVLDAGVLESEIVSGGETIILTLSNAEWEATVGADNALTTALIAGIDSAQSEATGWDAEVKANMTFAEVTRTNDTVVTITLAAEAAYAITANETITATIPDDCITSSGTVPIASPSFIVSEDSTSVVVIMTGTAVDGVSEGEIVAGAETIILTVVNTTWDADVGDDSAETTALIAGMDSNQAQAGGWDAQMITAGELNYDEVVRTSDTVVTITLPAVAAYTITANETITVDVPDSCLAASYVGIDPTFTITHTGERSINTVVDYSKINTVPEGDIVEIDEVPF